MNNITQENLNEQEKRIHEQHDIHEQQFKDKNKYYEQALLGTVNLSIGLVFASFLLFKKLV
tara:strand:- start:1371 stop:1553 length:183 start_codon:yes stop_codon:yes gene_type:complete